MGGNVTPISKIATTDNKFITTNTEGELTGGNQLIQEISDNDIEIIELQANASLTPIDHDSTITDTFSDSTGYLNSVNTGNTTATFDTNKYKNNTETTNSFGGTGQGRTWGNGASQNYKSSSFIPNRTSVITSISNCELKKDGNPNITLTFGIYSDDGSGKPDTLLETATETIDSSTDLTTSYTAKTFNFSTGVSVTSGTKYHFVGWITSGSGDSLNNIVVNTGTNIGEDIYISSDGTTWDIQSSDEGMQMIVTFDSTETQIVEIDLSAISGTITHTQLICNTPNREEGDNVTYDLIGADSSKDTSLSLDTKHELINVGGLQVSEGKIKINLVPKVTNPTVGVPSVKTYCLKVWKE